MAKDNSSKLTKLMELYKVRTALRRELNRAMSRAVLDSSLASIGMQVAALGDKAADAFNKREENRATMAQYKANVTEVNDRYDAQIDDITTAIEEMEEAKLKLIAAEKSAQKLEKAMVKAAKKRINSFDDIEQAQKDLEEAKKEMEANGGTASAFRDKIAEIERQIAEKQKELEEARENRKKELSDLTHGKDQSLQKQNIFSRLLALFGRNAAKKAEDLRIVMETRNESALARINDVRNKQEQNREGIALQREAISKAVRDYITQKRDAVVKFGKNTLELGNNVVDYIANSYELMANATKGMLQKAVARALEGLNNFAKGYEQTQERGDQLKAARDGIKGKLGKDKKDKDDAGMEMD